VLDSSASIQTPALTKLPEPVNIPTSSKTSPGRATINLGAPAPAGSVLVVSENYYPGWQAIVDGRAAQVYRANYNLLGVPLPAGARTVELSFHDPAYTPGKLLTIIALVASVLLLAAGAVAERSRRTAIA
jgi:uncharacterized membrane protein YfhO